MQELAGMKVYSLKDVCQLLKIGSKKGLSKLSAIVSKLSVDIGKELRKLSQNPKKAITR